MRLLRLLRFLFATVTLFAAPLAAAPESPKIAFDGSAILEAGTLVEISITDIPPAIDEFELLLLTDGGKFRLTPQLFGSGASIRWRVPALDTDRAVLLVRGGSHDRGERDLVRSRPFAIAHRHGEPFRYVMRQGEAWLVDDLVLPARAEAEFARNVASRRHAEADDNRVRFIQPPPAAAAAQHASAFASLSGPAAVLSRKPQVVPQRK